MAPFLRRQRASLRKAVLATLAGILLLVVGSVYTGPILSGGLFLLVPRAGVTKADHDLPESYQPLHRGHVDLSIGHYIRENEDLIVRGTPPLVLRRVYISGFRASRQFGIGAMHNGEWYVIGDPRRFQWAALIRPGLSRITFERTSSGTSFFNAMFEHRGSVGEWHGARLGWTGYNWALRKRDGSLLVFRPCGDSQPEQFCSIVRHRDADGHEIHYRRTPDGRLLRIETDDNRWIAFDYDDGGRIARAYDSAGGNVTYRYDARGRLERATAGTRLFEYTYTDRDEIETMREPGTDIENRYDANGRCTRQVNRYPDSDPYVFDFTYMLADDRVVATKSDRSDRTWLRYAFDTASYTRAEAWGVADEEWASVQYDRDPDTHRVRSMTLTCPDRKGLPLAHSSLVHEPGGEEAIKRGLLDTHCQAARMRSRSAQ